jgi:hypothetical protein
MAEKKTALILSLFLVLILLGNWCVWDKEYLLFSPLSNSKNLLGSILNLSLFLLSSVMAYRGSLKAELARLGFLFYYLHIAFISLAVRTETHKRIVIEMPSFLGYGGMIDQNNLILHLGNSLFILIMFIFLIVTIYLSFRIINGEKWSSLTFERVPREVVAFFLIFGIFALVAPLIFRWSVGFPGVESFMEDKLYLFQTDGHISFYSGINFPISYFIAKPYLHLCVDIPVCAMVSWLLFRKKILGFIIAPILLIKNALPAFSLFSKYSYIEFFQNSLFRMVPRILFEPGSFISWNPNDYNYVLFSVDMQRFLFLLFIVGCLIISILYLVKMKDMKKVG